MEHYHVLPENLILEVLSRLPVKTITQCKCVCKKWRHLISDPYFVDLHLSRSPPCLMFYQHIYCAPILELVEVEHEDRLTLHHVKSLDLHLSALGARVNIIEVGSVNGLICLYLLGDAPYVFNPVLEEYIILPKILSGVRTLRYGFGVSMAGDYKVILIFCQDPVADNLKEVPLQIEVYTLGTDRWRSLRPTPYNISYPGFLDSGVFVNGHVYWVIQGQVYDFDLDSETFELFPSPPGDDQESKRMVGVLKGRLSLFSGSSVGITVWVMKESWQKVIEIQENMDPVLKSPDWKPVFLIDGSEGTSVLIFRPKGTHSMVAYCLKRKKILDLDLKGGYFMTMHTYHPSFVKLQNFGSERVHSLYSNDSDSALVKSRYKSSLKFEQR